MEAITIQQEVQDFFSELSEDDQKQALELVKAFFANSDDDGSISFEQYNNEIDEALAEVARGNYFTQDEVEKQSAKWYKR